MTTEQVLERIREQERLVEAARDSWEEMKGHTAMAKKAYDGAVERLAALELKHAPLRDAWQTSERDRMSARSRAVAETWRAAARYANAEATKYVWFSASAANIRDYCETQARAAEEGKA